MKGEKGSKGTVHSAILSGIYGCFYILLFFYSPSTFLIVSQEFSIEFFRWYIWRLFGRFATFSIFFPLCSSLNFLRISSSLLMSEDFVWTWLSFGESDPHESLPFHLLLFSTASSKFSRIVVLSCCFTLPNNILSFSLFLSCLFNVLLSWEFGFLLLLLLLISFATIVFIKWSDKVQKIEDSLYRIIQIKIKSNCRIYIRCEVHDIFKGCCLMSIFNVTVLLLYAWKSE